MYQMIADAREIQGNISKTEIKCVCLITRGAQYMRTINFNKRTAEKIDRKN